MSAALKKLGKLKGRSLHELRVRGAQLLAAHAERYRMSTLARLPTDAQFFRMLEAPGAKFPISSAEALLDHFRTRTSPKFFAAFSDPEEARRKLQSRFEADSQTVIERARRIITEGRFDLLGLRDLSFGNPPDWHLEPVACKRAPLLHWSRINYLDAEVAGDKKITWELNRHQYFSTLGRAYWLTKDELYAETFAAHLQSWTDENPPKMGINWSSSLELSFRAISWLWAFHFFKDSVKLTPALFSRALKFLYLHARHLETYLSTYFSPNTHLTGEALGLYYLGTMLPEFREAARWRELGQSILLDALDFQLRADGVYFEQSSYYHRYTADFYTHFYILSQINGQTIEPKLVRKLTALLDHLMYITRPDGTSPLIGDDDGGRLVMLDERAAGDFRSTLATAAALLSRGDYKYVAGRATEETLWLLGCDGLRAFDEVRAETPAQESRAFRESGYFVMRDGWTKNANYLLVDCGPHGAANHAHAHADALAFELAARGRTLLVDAGTYTYTGSAEMRDLFRSSAAHNTLTVDGESSSVPAGPFGWQDVAQTTLRTWLSHPRFDYFEGEHNGYERLTSPATHTRSLLFLKGGYWIMRDRVRTRGAHRYDLHFHFNPDTDPRVDEKDERASAVREEWSARSGLEIISFGGEWSMEKGWVSSCYGQRALAPVCSFSTTAEGEHEILTLMIPRQQSPSTETLARQRSVTGGSLIEVRQSDGYDILTVGDECLIESERWASDFGWSWARFTSDGARLEELLLVGGHRFFLDGRAIFDSKRRASYVSARRVEGELLLETDAQEGVRLPLEDEGAHSRVYSF